MYIVKVVCNDKELNKISTCFMFFLIFGLMNVHLPAKSTGKVALVNDAFFFIIPPISMIDIYDVL